MAYVAYTDSAIVTALTIIARTILRIIELKS